MFAVVSTLEDGVRLAVHVAGTAICASAAMAMVVAVGVDAGTVIVVAAAFEVGAAVTVSGTVMS